MTNVVEQPYACSLSSDDCLIQVDDDSIQVHTICGGRDDEDHSMDDYDGSDNTDDDNNDGNNTDDSNMDDASNNNCMNMDTNNRIHNNSGMDNIHILSTSTDHQCGTKHPTSGRTNSSIDENNSSHRRKIQLQLPLMPLWNQLRFAL